MLSAFRKGYKSMGDEFGETITENIIPKNGGKLMKKGQKNRSKILKKHKRRKNITFIDSE